MEAATTQGFNFIELTFARALEEDLRILSQAVDLAKVMVYLIKGTTGRSPYNCRDIGGLEGVPGEYEHVVAFSELNLAHAGAYVLGQAVALRSE